MRPKSNRRVVVRLSTRLRLWLWLTPEKWVIFAYPISEKKNDSMILKNNDSKQTNKQTDD